MVILSGFTNFLFYIYAFIVFIIVLGVIICIHEAGHLFFAKKAGILCHEYSIGMGPIIKQWKKPGKETAISIRSIPLGGFVAMAGEDNNESLLKEGQEIKINLDQNNIVTDIIVSDKVSGNVSGKVVSYDLYAKDGDELFIDLDVDGNVIHYAVLREAHYVFSPKEKIQIAPYDRCFESKKWWPKFWTVFGGPLMNFVLALFIFLIVGMVAGVPNTKSTKIAELTELYPASRVLKVGDSLKAINGETFDTWTEFSATLAKHMGEEVVSITYERDGKTYTSDVETIIVSYRLGVANFDNNDTEGDGNYIYHSDEGLKVAVVYSKSYVASKAGIVNGDIILGYYDGNNLVKTTSWKTLLNYISQNPDMDELKLSVKHADGSVEDITSQVWKTDSIDSLGLDGEAKTAIGVGCETKFSFFGGIGNAFALFGNSIATVYKTLWALISNSQIHVTDLSGPVGIFSAVKSYLSTDFVTFMSFVGLISANIGVVNLLPIPALDGGRIVFLFYEGITKKKVSKKFENTLNNIVFFLLMGLFVLVTVLDIIRMIRG